PEDKTILTSSFAFDLGYTSLYTSILNGAQLHILPKEIYLLVERLLEYIRRHSITYIKITPSLFSIIVNSPDFSEKICNSLRIAVLGGEAINVKDIEYARAIYPRLRIMNHYGPTEATIGCVATYIDFDKIEAYREHPVIGRPINNTSVYILDRNRNILPVGVPGELGIAGIGLARGYLNRPELTAEKFTKNNLKEPTTHNGHLYDTIYRTGDLARWMPDGTIDFMGRIDKQVKVKGYRIELGEIENRLLEHQLLDEAVVAVRDDHIKKKTVEEDEKFLCAYVVPRGTSADTGRKKPLEKILTLKEIAGQENLAAPLPDHTGFDHLSIPRALENLVKK
ncbi:MAG: amino acid adenylation domain-containing protein, partial [bacterium]|nr:amino acid adenylation domain-containing protein [bacterium]